MLLWKKNQQQTIQGRCRTYVVEDKKIATITLAAQRRTFKVSNQHVKKKYNKKLNDYKLSIIDL